MQVYKQDSVSSVVLWNVISSLQATNSSLQAGFRRQWGSEKRVFKSTSKNCKSSSRIPNAVWFFTTYFQVYKQQMQVFKQESVDSEVLKNGFSSLQARNASLKAGFRTQCASPKQVFKSTSKNCKSASRNPYAVWFFKTGFQVYKQELQVYKQDSVRILVL